MADLPNRIDAINERLDRIDRRRESLELQIEGKNKIGADPFFDERILRDLNREAEALSAERNALQDQQGDQTSAKGQTAESQVENKQPPTFQGEGVQAFTPNPEPLTNEEATKVGTGAVFNPDGEAVAFGQERSATASQDDEFVIPGLQGGASSNLITTVGQNKAAELDKAKEQNAMRDRAVLTRTNVLHDYSTYTYRITLYMLTKLEYKNVVKNPDEFTPKHVLMSSGGGYPQEGSGFDFDNTPGRHPDFQEDFFIDNLKMTTVVGMNKNTKASNAITVSFDIFEPYGISLLDRLISACEVTAQCPNYLVQPYLLEIDFLGNPGLAAPGTTTNVIQGTRKRIPIKFIEMAISPSTGGTQYRIQAIPFNHSAFQQSSALPLDISCDAEKLGEFFDSPSDIETTIIDNAVQERAASDLKKALADMIYGGNSLSPLERGRLEQRFTGQAIARTRSYPGAFNAYHRSLAGPKKAFILPQLQVEFIIDKRFKDAKLVDNLVAESRTTPMTDRQNKLKQSYGPGFLAQAKTFQVFQVAAGTNIVQLIDRAMIASDYITTQISEWNKVFEESKKSTAPNREAALDKYKYLNWYKVIPNVRLGEYDPTYKGYSKTLVYNVIPFKVANAHHPSFHKTKIAKESIVRSYNYLYTGQNTDITSIKIDFDSAYYTAYTQYNNEKATGGTTRTVDADSGEVKPSQEVNTDDAGETGQTIIRGGDKSGAGTLNAQANPLAHTAADIADSIYSSSRGDMINVKLGIIGDPAFIKQDDVYYSPQSQGYDRFSITNDNQQPITTDGQIIFDTSQVFVQLLVGGAIDIDDNTGITNKGSTTGPEIKLLNGRKLNSSFSGVYKVITVESTLSGGAFTQTLDLIKMPNSNFSDQPQVVQLNLVPEAIVKQEDSSRTAPSGGLFANAIAQIVNDIDTAGLLAAAEQAPDGVFPIVNGAGTTPVEPVVTESSPVNVNDSVAFNGQIVNT